MKASRAQRKNFEWKKAIVNARQENGESCGLTSIRLFF